VAEHPHQEVVEQVLLDKDLEGEMLLVILLGVAVEAVEPT
jgi:hypothetical protein